MLMVDLMTILLGLEILLHGGYELVKKEFVMIYFFVYINMSYYWFNRKGVLQKAKDIS